MVPMVMVDQMYCFDRDSLMKAIGAPKGMSAKDFTPAAEELFTQTCRWPTTPVPPTSIALSTTSPFATRRFTPPRPRPTGETRRSVLWTFGPHPSAAPAGSSA
jgi:hypothetical protein